MAPDGDPAPAKAVGWNCTNSRSLNAAPASLAKQCPPPSACGDPVKPQKVDSAASGPTTDDKKPAKDDKKPAAKDDKKPVSKVDKKAPAKGGKKAPAVKKVASKSDKKGKKK